MKLLNKVAIFIAVFSIASTGHTFIDPPQLETGVVQEGQIVNLLLRTGICAGIVGGANNPAVTIEGAVIDVLINGIRESDPIWCNFPIVDHAFTLGSYGAGDYTVRIRFRYTPFGLPTVIEELGELPLLVRAHPALQSIPTTSKLGSGLIIILTLFTACLVFRNVKGAPTLLSILLICIIFQPKTLAQPSEDRIRLHIMLGSGPEAPTPEDIVEDWDFSAPPPTPG